MFFFGEGFMDNLINNLMRDQGLYEQALDMIKNVKPYQVLSINPEGCIESSSSGIIDSIWKRVRKGEGDADIPEQRKLTESKVIQILLIGIKNHWTPENETGEILAQFRTYQERQKIYNSSSIFQRLVSPLVGPTVSPVQPQGSVVDEAPVSRLQALVRGKEARNKVVIPSQIIPQLRANLSKKLVSDEKLAQMAIALSRQINELSLAGELSKGKSVRLSADPIHSYSSIFKKNEEGRLEYQGKQEVALEFDCWVEIPVDGKGVNLLVSTKNVLGTGGFKTVNEAHEFKIDLKLSLSKTRGVGHTAAVLSRVHTIPDSADGLSIKTNNETDDSILGAVKEGLLLHKLLLSIPGVKLAELPVTRLPDYEGRQQDSAMELKQRWYNGDLAQFIAKGTIPIDLKNLSKTRPLSKNAQLNIVLDVAKTLALFHERGYIHRDVKPLNILLGFDEEKKVTGFLSDFDLATKAGFVDFIGPYMYWDESSQAGWVLPSCDCYGLGMALGELFLPGFYPGDTDSFNAENFVWAAIEKDLNGLRSRAGDRIEAAFSVCTSISDAKTTLAEKLTLKDLTKSERDFLINLKKDILIAETIGSIVDEQIRGSPTVLDYLVANPTIAEEVNSDDMETKKAALVKVEEGCNFLSATKMCSILEGLQQNLQQLE